MDPKTRVLPVGRTEVPVEGDKYTIIIIDHRPGKEGLAVLRDDRRWIDNDEIVGGKMLVAVACELERCRDLLYEIAGDFDPDEVLGPPCGPEMLRKIMETLPSGYRPAVYLDDRRERDLQQVAERFRNTEGHAADDARLSLLLRKSADEHREDLRRSRENGDLQVFSDKEIP